MNVFPPKLNNMGKRALHVFQIKLHTFIFMNEIELTNTIEVPIFNHKAGKAAVDLGIDELVGLDQCRVHMLLYCKDSVYEFLDGFGAVIHLLLMNPIGGSGHALDHVAVGHTEAGIVFEKIAVREHVGDDELVLDQGVALQKKGIAGVGVNDELVDYAEFRKEALYKRG
jgi:hypothetical protein